MAEGAEDGGDEEEGRTVAEEQDVEDEDEDDVEDGEMAMTGTAAEVGHGEEHKERGEQ